MKNEKMKKTSVVIDRILHILQILVIVGLILAVVVGGVIFLFWDQLISNADMSVTTGLLSITTDSGSALVNGSMLRSCMILGAASALVLGGLSFYGIKLIRRILGPMKEGRPFDEGVSFIIRRLAWVVLIGGAVNEIVGAVCQIMEIAAYDLSSFFDPNVVVDYRTSYVLNIGFIIPVCVLFLLSHVFRYGEELQRESDETL